MHSHICRNGCGGPTGKKGGANRGTTALPQQQESHRHSEYARVGPTYVVLHHCTHRRVCMRKPGWPSPRNPRVARTAEGGSPKQAKPSRPPDEKEKKNSTRQPLCPAEAATPHRQGRSCAELWGATPSPPGAARCARRAGREASTGSSRAQGGRARAKAARGDGRGARGRLASLSTPPPPPSSSLEPRGEIVEKIVRAQGCDGVERVVAREHPPRKCI